MWERTRWSIGYFVPRAWPVQRHASAAGKGDIIAGCTHRAAADGAVWWLGAVRAVHHKGGQTANETTVLAICYLDNHRRRRCPPPPRSPRAHLRNERGIERGQAKETKTVPPLHHWTLIVEPTIPVDVILAYLANFEPIDHRNARKNALTSCRACALVSSSFFPPSSRFFHPLLYFLFFFPLFFTATRVHRMVFFFPFVSSRFSFGCISLLEQGREKRWLWSRETRKYSLRVNGMFEELIRGALTISLGGAVITSCRSFQELKSFLKM